MFIFLLLVISQSKLLKNFCKHDEFRRNLGESRTLSEYTRETGWDKIRIIVDWSNISSSSKSKYKDYLESAIDYYSNSLKVHRISSPVTPKSSDFSVCTNKVSDFEGQSLEGDYFVMMLEEFDSSAEYAAYAGGCSTDSITNQPVFGIIAMNTAYTDEYDEKTLVGVFTHEFTHALGFTRYDMPYWLKSDGITYGNDYYYEDYDVRGAYTIYLTTPKVIEKTRETFGCDDLPGLELETQGGDGTAYSHWNARIVYNELMNPQVVSADFIYSELTFAALEDSGWYQPDYSYAQPLLWGADKGCSFHTKKCIVNDDITFSEFCMDLSASSLCTFDYINKGYCGIFEYNSEIPSEYAYFSNEFIGGDTFTDYCPIVEANQNCRVPGCGILDYGEEICDECRCVEGTYGLSGEYSALHAACHYIECSNGSVVIHVGDQQVTCTNTGEFISIPGFYGKLKCPDVDIICADSPCLKNCYGGKCVNGACLDNSMNHYDDYDYCNDDNGGTDNGTDNGTDDGTDGGTDNGGDESSQCFIISCTMVGLVSYLV